MLGARSMAVVGASARPDSFGSRMVIEAQRGSARVHLVNPRYDRIGDAAVCAVAGRPGRARRPGAARGARRRAARAVGGRRGRGCAVGRAVRVRPRAARQGRGDRHRRRHGGVRCGLHGLRQQRTRRACVGVPGAGSVARRRRQPRHPLRFGVLDAVARPPRVRLPAGGVVRAGTRHRHRGLRRVRARRSRDADHRAADGDAARSPAAAEVAAARRGAGRAGGDPHRRRLAARAGHGGRALGCAGG